MPIWTWETWVWQQGGCVISEDRTSTCLRGAESMNALNLLASLYARGYASRNEDYTAAEQTFLEGQAAVLLNGTWVVDSYLAQARKEGPGLKEYTAMTVPRLFHRPDVWADGHVWIIPRSPARDSRKAEAALSFLRFLYEHSGAWARTGHLPVRLSVLDSEAFLSLPLRAGYVASARYARSFPQIENHRAIQFALGQELNATWLLPRPPAQSLEEADYQVMKILRRNLEKQSAQ